MAMMGIAPVPAHESEALSPATDGSRADAPRVRGLLQRMMPRGHYSALGAEQGTVPPQGRTPEMPPAVAGYAEKPRRGWLRRLIPQEGVQRRRWKNLAGAGASRRLAALSRSLRWKRLSGLSVNLRGSWASALLDTVAFRVMYVVEAVVLGLALSCFFCCCGCKI